MALDYHALAGPDVVIETDVPLARYTSFRIGGSTSALVTVYTQWGLAEVVRRLRLEEISPRILGRGSNILASDEGVDGPVIRLDGELAQFSFRGDVALVAGGGLLPHLARAACEAGLAGLERMAGIPGSLAGALVMNAGCEGQSIGEVVEEVTAMTREREIVQLDASELTWGYRESSFCEKQKDLIILGARLRLAPGDARKLSDDRLRVLRERRERFPLSLPSAGSFFRNTDKGPAGRLIDEVGLKGTRQGGAQISEKHGNFIVNCGGATCSDVTVLAERAQARVRERFGVALAWEVERW